MAKLGESLSNSSRNPDSTANGDGGEVAGVTGWPAVDT